MMYQFNSLFVVVLLDMVQRKMMYQFNSLFGVVLLGMVQRKMVDE